MIIYRDLKYKAETRDYLNKINLMIEQLVCRQAGQQHDAAVELFIDYSDLETALTDHVTKDEEISSPFIKILRQTGKLIGQILLKSWQNNSEIIDKKTAEELRKSLTIITSYQLPEIITVKVPEGYAYYGYFPETYIESAEKFYKAIQPKEVVVIGIRSIGTSFSNAVAAFLESKGSVVSSFTVRPSGDYNNRYLNLSRELKFELSSRPDRHFLIIDEGPGLSGSSFGITAETISGLAIADDNIVFISSWQPDNEGSGLISEIGKKRWRMHKSFSSSFEDTWVKTGRLANRMPHNELTDISNGKWRSIFYRNDSEYPAIYPVEERRKYLSSKYPLRITKSFFNKKRELSISRKNEEIYFIKFVGLGRYGKRYYERSKILSHSLLTPHSFALENGFLISHFVKGHPLGKEQINFEMLNNAAEYLNYLCNMFPSSPSRSFEEMFEMLTENTCECINKEWVQKLEKQQTKLARQYSRFAVGVDGHMFPHDWIISRNKCYKTDSLTHHADQFFPGCQSILWDIAGFSIESDLERQKEQFLINRFCEISGQRQIQEYLSFYKLTYLAFRMGLTSVASDVLSNSPDGRRVKSQADWYTAKMKREITELCS